jgi:uncharacterized membrane protein YagU involved in acid resistance
MENDFFKLFDLKASFLSLDVGYSSITDWTLDIKERHTNKVIIQVQHCSRKEVFAKAYCELAEYYSDVFGGY